MTASALHPIPASTAVVGAQLRATRLAMTKAAVIFFVVVLICEGLALFGDVYGGTTAHVATDPRSVGLAIIAGVVAALSAWRDERPSARAYHFTMPVPRGLHTVAKLFAGWIWLLVGVLALRVLCSGVDATDAYVVGQPWLVPDTQPWHWVVPFAAASVVYFLTSIVVIASDHPLAWVTAAVVAMVVSEVVLPVTATKGSPRAVALSRGTLSVLHGEHGLWVPVFDLVVPVPELPRAGRNVTFDVFGGLVSFNSGTSKNSNRRTDSVLVSASGGRGNVGGGRLLPVLPSPPRFGVWLRASMIWLLVGIAGSWLAAHKYRRT